MRQEYTLTATPKQFLQLAAELKGELESKGTYVIQIRRGFGAVGFIVRAQEYTIEDGFSDYGYSNSFTKNWEPDSADSVDDIAVVEIFLSGESEQYRDKGTTLIVRDWDGKASKLVMEYGEARDRELAEYAWKILGQRVTENGWELKQITAAANSPLQQSAAAPAPQGQPNEVAGTKQSPPGKFAFLYMTGGWMVRFEGREILLLGNLKGYSIAHHLLKNLNRDVGIDTLSDVVEGRPSGIANMSKGEQIEEKISLNNRIARSRTNPDSDELDKGSSNPESPEYKQTIAALEAELTKARMENNTAEENRIDKILAMIGSKAESKAEESSARSDRERKRIRMHNAWTDALSKIRDTDEELYKHLKVSISVGVKSHYRTDPPISWDT